MAGPRLHELIEVRLPASPPGGNNEKPREERVIDGALQGGPFVGLPGGAGGELRGRQRSRPVVVLPFKPGPAVSGAIESVGRERLAIQGDLQGLVGI
ncbi:MAG: hypothetical protein ACKOJF_06010 [Planctomycetaceae bacterium]